VFRRTQKEVVDTPAEAKAGGKGRPTPTRKEAQAAAKQRAKGGIDPKAPAKQQRAQRAAANARMRQGIRNGDEKFLPDRDRGPVRRFIRDWVDARLTFIELLLPALIIVMMLSLSSSRNMQTLGNSLYTVLWLLVIIDVVWMFFRLGRELKRRFPNQQITGWRFYSIMRAMQLRPLRIPKPQVKLWDKLDRPYH